MKKEKAQTGARPVGANCVRPHIKGMAKNNIGVAPLGDPHSRGITLIALIITIIVMLILVGVSVTVALNGGLFRTAKDAAGETATKRNEELTLSDGKVKINGEWYNSINEYVNGAGGNSGGSTSTVSFKLCNRSTGKWATYTAPSDAVWGDLYEYAPDAARDSDEDKLVYQFANDDLFDNVAPQYACPNTTEGFVRITATTLIVDAPIPHRWYDDVEVSSDEQSRYLYFSRLPILQCIFITG